MKIAKIAAGIVVALIGIDRAGAIKTLGNPGCCLCQRGGLSGLAQGAKDRVTGGDDPCQTARTWHLK